MMATMNYTSDARGNMGTIFALSLAAMLAAVGAAVDVSGAVSGKAKLQRSIDGAVLAASSQTNMSKNDVKALIRTYVDDAVGHDRVSLQFKVDKDIIEVIASDAYDTALLGLIGKDEFTYSVRAGTPRNKMQAVDVALVLDTTDSMAGANMDALKEAVEELIEEFEDADSDVRIAVVPYAEYVNIGVEYAGQSWLDHMRPDEFVPERVNRYEVTHEVTPRVCTPSGPLESRPIYQDGVLTGYRDHQPQTCTGGERVGTGEFREDVYPAFTRTYEWGGCAGSRNDPHNLRADADVMNPIIGATYRTGRPQDVPCGARLLPLTDNLDRVEDHVESLTTSGQTYIPSGLIWGWRVLDPSVPFTQAASGTNRYPVMIFMSDGGNVRSQNNEYHNGNDHEAGTQHARRLCEAVKATGIRLYTVAYDIPAGGIWSSSPATFMTDCASSYDTAYTAANASELKSAFRDIVSNLREVRLTY